jgi:hypothetical protein
MLLVALVFLICAGLALVAVLESFWRRLSSLIADAEGVLTIAKDRHRELVSMRASVSELEHVVSAHGRRLFEAGPPEDRRGC